MFARVYGCTIAGVEGKMVDVEVFLSSQLPSFDIVGLPDTAVKEARDRVRAALKNSSFRFPPQRVIVNLAPADVKKEGPQLDLALAMGILQADGQLVSPTATWAFIGELALDGALRAVRGVLAMVLAARDAGYRNIMLPLANAEEASLVTGVHVVPATSLKEAVAVISGEQPPPAVPRRRRQQRKNEQKADFKNVKGQESAKRALEVAAAGGHNVLMIGTPGSGKTMLARCVPSILPPMTEEESLETTKIYSAAGLLVENSGLISERPFRSPHHSLTPAALCGGGRNPRPGEVSLAHNGALFLDELPEFRRETLEVLRQPLEEGSITVTRLQAAYTYPSRFMLLASMNPCPCGMLSDAEKECVCSAGQIYSYRRKISGPLLDRIDLFVEVTRLRYDEVAGTGQGEPSSAIAARVGKARSLQAARFAGHGIKCNAEMLPRHIQQFCKPDAAGRDLLRQAFSRLHLSARAYDRILKVARTIADLDGEEDIRTKHIAEAISYRQTEFF